MCHGIPAKHLCCLSSGFIAASKFAVETLPQSQHDVYPSTQNAHLQAPPLRCKTNIAYMTIWESVVSAVSEVVLGTFSGLLET
jgi:hypothetical protein